MIRNSTTTKKIIYDFLDPSMAKLITIQRLHQLGKYANFDIEVVIGRKITKNHTKSASTHA